MKIVDLSTDVAGRFAARLFALAGQDVLRPVTGPLAEDDVLSLYLDAGKARVAEASDLLAGADLLFTSFDRGAPVGLAQTVGAVPDDCVVVTTSSFGMTGPYSSYRGGPMADWASSGYLFITGDPNREPVKGPDQLCAYIAGYTAAMAAEAALARRRQTGEGQHVDVSTMETMLGLHQSTFARAAAGILRERTGRYAEVYPLTVLPCRDGHVSLGVVTDDEFDRFVIAIGCADLTVDPRFADQANRWLHRDALDRALDSFLRSHGADEIVALLQANGVPATKVADALSVLGNPQMADRGFWAEAEGSRRSGRMPGNPVPPARRYASVSAAVPTNPPSPPIREGRDDLPLSGIRVLDLTAFWAGPSATRCLADLGAEVIWIERPRSRVDFDESGSDPRTLVASLYHRKMNRHKRSVVLDLHTEEGRAVARRLAGHADVLIENFRPGVAERLGLGPEALCSAHPQLVYVSLSGFGSAGPWGDWRSFGPNIEAASAVMARTGYRDGPPLRLGHALPDGVGGVVGALAALRGLREREEQGRGGWFDLSQLEFYTALCGEDILAASMAGEAAVRNGNRSQRPGVVQGVFPCQGEEQWIALRLEGDAELAGFATVVRRSDIGGGPQGEADRLERVEQQIAQVTRTWEKHALATALQGQGLEAFPVMSAFDLIADGHLAQRDYLVRTGEGTDGYLLPGFPARSNRSLADPHGSAPRFGEHSAEVLAWLDPAPAGRPVR